MQAESETGASLSGETEGPRDGEDEETRKRRRLNIREITD